MARGWNQMICKVPSSPNHSMIRFYNYSSSSPQSMQQNTFKCLHAVTIKTQISQILALTKAVAEAQWILTYFALETKSNPINFYSLAAYFTVIITLEEQNSKIICCPATSPQQITPQNTHVSDPNLRSFFTTTQKICKKSSLNVACSLNFLAVASKTKDCKNTCCVRRVCLLVLITHSPILVIYRFP